MDRQIYADALKNALVEVKKVCPDIKRAFVLMDDGTIVVGDEQATGPSVDGAANSLRDLNEKGSCVGGLNNLLIEGEKGKVLVSQVKSMSSVMGLSQRADLTLVRTVNGIVLPTIIKVLDGISSETQLPAPSKPAPIVQLAPLRPALPEQFEVEQQVEEPLEPEFGKEEIETTEPLESTREEVESEEVDEEPSESAVDLPSQQLIVDKFGGFMVRADTVQVDSEMLERWSSLLEVKEVNEVDLETFSGKATRCKVKAISDPKFEGRGIIRIPDKTCDSLELRRGELVRVKAVMPEE